MGKLTWRITYRYPGIPAWVTTTKENETEVVMLRLADEFVLLEVVDAFSAKSVLRESAFRFADLYYDREGGTLGVDEYDDENDERDIDERRTG